MKGKDTDRKVLKLLYRSLDGDLKDKDRKKLDEALEQSEELRREKERILEQRQAVADSASQSFGPFFAERVMRRIEGLGQKKNGWEAFYESFMGAFRKVAIVSAAVLVILISYNVIKSDIVPEDELFFMADTTMEEILDLPLF
jgi:anti-sigma factor RsiW